MRRRSRHAERVRMTREPMIETTGDLIRSHAVVRPDAAALAAPGRDPMTYAALAAFIDRIAEDLAALGFGAGDRIALAIAPRPEMAAAHLAVSNACVSLPLDPLGATDELAAAMRALKAKALICADAAPPAARAAAGRLGLETLTLFPSPDGPAGGFALAGGAPSTPVRPRRPGGGDLAMVIRTSGTSARPRAAPIRHALAVMRGRIEAEAFALSPEDRCLNFRPLHLHSALNAGLAAPLAAGGAVILPDAFEPGLALRQIVELGATWYLGSPAYHEAMLEALRRRPEALAGARLRFVRSSSYRLSPEMMAAVEAATGVPVLERLGGTEAGLILRSPPPPEIRRPGRAGLPFANEVALLGDGGFVDALGEIGEIVVRGPGVFDGYEDDETATRDAFFDGWFRTGDLGRRDADGYFEVCGRLKDVINRGGQKISPLDVEDAIAAHPDIAEAACFGAPHPTLGEDVAAALVMRPGAAPLDAQALERFLSPRFARHRIPKQVVILEALPRGPTGKLLRRDLVAALAGPASTTERPRSAREAEIAAIFASVLKVETVGRDDNFFGLGGDSLMAARLAAEIGDVTGAELPAECVFGEGGSVAGLAALVEAALAGEIPPRPAAGPIARRRADAPTPLSFSQERLRFLSEVDPNAQVYNTQGAIRLTGPLKIHTLRRALNELVARHESLRSSYPIENGDLRQEIAPTLTLDLPVSDLSGLAPDAREAEVMRLAKEEALRPYDLSRGPLLRARLLRCGPEDHALLLPRHHLISDGQSAGVLYREIAALYTALETGAPHPPPPPIQYGDYAAWQRARLSGDGLEQSLAYWLDHLEGAPPLLDLPTDRPRPKTQSYRGGRIWFSCPASLAEKIGAFARREGVTPFIAMLAAFQVLMHRYSGQEDFVIGTVVGGRIRPETQNLIGLFVNTLALRARVGGDDPVGALVARVRAAVAGAYAHQEMPFDRLVQELKPDRSASHPPVAQVLFGLMPADLKRVETETLTFERMNVDLGSARFDLSVMIGEDHGALDGFLEYSADLFDRETIEDMARQFETLLESLAEAEADAPVTGLRLMTAAEEADLLTRCIGPETPLPSGRIPELFAAQARAAPDADAIRWRGGRMSYGELHARALDVAGTLTALGAAPNDLIAVDAARRPETIAALLGVMFAGCAYLPLGAGAPPLRREFMLGDAGAGFSLDPATGAARALAGGGKVETADDGEPVACVMYTSGSTGRPKGVAVPHRAIVRLVVGADYVDLSPAETVLQLAPIGFDAAAFEIWGALLNGGCVAQVTAARPSLADILRAIRELRPTVGWFTAGLFHELVDHAPEAFHGVRQVLAGGDRLSPDHVARFLRANPGSRLTNGYGPTENGTFTTAHLFDAGFIGDRAAPIGRPISNARAYILGPAGDLAPSGVPGRIWAGGAGVAAGYVNRPDLTAERFRPDPFSRTPGARIYDTGDRGRIGRGGTIDFLGRDDAQIKIDGFRVEPAEIEAALAAHEGVGSAAVVAAERRGVRALFGFVAPETAPTGEPLSRFLAERLPGHMIPADLTAVEALPLTANGKVDRKELVRRVLTAGGEAGAGRAPETPMERLVAEIWRETLGVAVDGIDRNFFDLGGTSLLAMRMMFRLGEEIGEDLPMSLIFEAPTLGELSGHARATAGAHLSGDAAG